MKKILSLLGALLFLILIIGSCEENENNDNAPSLPPETAFVMPFSAFTNPNDTLATKNSSIEGITHKNWGTAFIQTGVWNIIITVGMAIPVASFVEAFKHEAVYNVDTKKWEWSYNFSLHTAVLSGMVADDSVHWEMKISKANTFSNFSWYTGASHINGSGGYWILNEGPTIQTALLKIDWENDSETETGNIKYTNIKSGGTENGGYIHYGSNTNTSYNRYYSIYNKGQDNLTEIEWNFETKNGHIKNPLAFLDENWHCWGTDLSDIDCD